MGIKFGREYEDIIVDLKQALTMVDGFYDLFEMTLEDWSELDDEQQKECLQTLADDIFYGLGSDPEMNIGSGLLRHDPSRHVIQVHNGDNLVSVIYLV
ncbi:hypothetical protein D3C73_478060 [compost metagenome]